MENIIILVFYPVLSLNQDTENILRQYRLMTLEFLKKELIVFINGISNQYNILNQV